MNDKIFDAPSWDDFCARLLEHAPALKPDARDEQWRNLYAVYEMGYLSCLETMKALLQEDPGVGNAGSTSRES